MAKNEFKRSTGRPMVVETLDVEISDHILNRITAKEGVDIQTAITNMVRNVDSLLFRRGFKPSLLSNIVGGVRHDFSISELKAVSEAIDHRDFNRLVACATLTFNIHYIVANDKEMAAGIDAIDDNAPDGAYFAMAQEVCRLALMRGGFGFRFAERHAHDTMMHYFKAAAKKTEGGNHGVR